MTTRSCLHREAETVRWEAYPDISVDVQVQVKVISITAFVEDAYDDTWGCGAGMVDPASQESELYDQMWTSMLQEACWNPEALGGHSTSR